MKLLAGPQPSCRVILSKARDNPRPRGPPGVHDGARFPSTSGGIASQPTGFLVAAEKLPREGWGPPRDAAGRLRHQRSPWSSELGPRSAIYTGRASPCGNDPRRSSRGRSHALRDQQRPSRPRVAARFITNLGTVSFTPLHRRSVSPAVRPFEAVGQAAEGGNRGTTSLAGRPGRGPRRASGTVLPIDKLPFLRLAPGNCGQIGFRRNSGRQIQRRNSRRHK